MAYRSTMAYYLPQGRLAEALSRGVNVGHCWYDNFSYMAAAQALGMQVDAELGVHSGGWTTGLIVQRLQAIVAAGHTNTVRRLLLIDEPDIHPVGTWNMTQMRSFYEACHSVGSWPVFVTVRAHSSTLAQADPWFATDLSDGIAWDPYLAAYPFAESQIQNEAVAIRNRMNVYQLGKPLTCVLQAGYVGWAQSLPQYPAVRPTAQRVLSMGLAAKAGSAIDFGLWFESDWSQQPTTPPTWDDIAVATAGWQDPVDAALMTARTATASGLSNTPTVAKPTDSASGDKLIIVINHNVETVTTSDNNGATPTTKTGEYPAAAGYGAFAVFTRIMGGSEPASYTFLLSSSQRWSISAIALRGYDAGSLFDVAPAFGESHASTSIPCPSITTGVQNTWVLAVAGVDGELNGIISGIPSGFSALTLVNAQQPHCVAYRQYPDIATTGTATFIKSSQNDNFSYSMALFSVAIASAITGRARRMMFRRRR